MELFFPIDNCSKYLTPTPGGIELPFCHFGESKFTFLLNLIWSDIGIAGPDRAVSLLGTPGEHLSIASREKGDKVKETIK